MDKAPPEKSSSFAHKDREAWEESNPSAAPPDSPAAVEAKVEGDGTPSVNNVDKIEEEKEEKEEGKEAEESVEANPPEDATPKGDDDAPHSFDKILEDIDNFLSYLAVETETNTSLEVHELSIHRFLDLVQEKVSNYIADVEEGKSRWGQHPDDDSSILQAVARVSKLNASLDGSKWGESSGLLINRVGRIHQQAMALLEDEFRALLEDCKPVNVDNNGDENKDTKQEGDDHVEDGDKSLDYPQDAVSHLNKIAKEMISGGYETECCQVFILMRRNTIDELLSKIGFDGISMDDVQKMHWESLQREITKWVETLKQSVGVYFPSELKLIESVFTGCPDTSAYLFCNLTRSIMIQMLNFAESIAISKRSPEKLFKFLDMYEALRDMDPIINGLFGEDKGHEFVKSELVTARSRLGEATVSIFCDLENSIRSDTAKNVVPGGAIHPLTRYIMNYLELTCEYKDTLEQVFRDHLKIERADSNNRAEFQGDNSAQYQDPNEAEKSQFSLQIAKVMDLLDSYLEKKAKLYKDISLSSIFMMNNGRYILQKVKGSPQINELMGDQWRRKKSSDLRQCHKNYQRETWNKVLGCLRDDHGLTVNGKVMKPELKERFKNFNAMFDEIHKTQSSWVVCDEQLQSELRVSISAVVIPAYRSFLGRFAQTLTPGRQSEKYIKYQSDDLETLIDELFDGNPAMTGKRK
ncbi:exocyst complex component EXO70B1 [Punica granatum]|uniref:Exocyst subunit Exo70 family protein n=2 Tax=Punica granatum TaxID=22663 RepID=A0A218WDW5_PUNGR|nr:exocyst complex component EXO70B1 [Punica granatum]OWM70723.1 hypothetical protein CDL15_Pgr014396 [Punica granatum]PKI44548.1 hypothetical protein CRG98_035048 [Punica granatum]